MNIVIAGGSGLVGKALTDYLLQQGHSITILTRNRPTNTNSKFGISYVTWLNKGDKPEHSLKNIDAFINLAGESISSGRWNSERKSRILNSRLNANLEIHRIISSLEKKPEVLINASAIGYYGTSLTKTFTEDSVESGNDFLAQTVKAWEQEAIKVETTLGIRLVCARFGIILDRHAGALPKLLIPYKLYGGGNLGSGKQWMSWIHIKDVVQAIEFCLQHKQLKGPINFVAPQPMQMNEFGQTIGKILNRPHWLTAPSFAIKLALGEMSLLILEGQKVLPTKLQTSGYSFRYDNLNSALQDILK